MNIEARQRIYNAAYKPAVNPDKTKSLSFFQSKAQKKRADILASQAKAKAEREKILARYAPAVAQEKVRQIDGQLLAEVTAAKADLKGELDAILSAKKNSFTPLHLHRLHSSRLRCYRRWLCVMI